MKDPEAIDTKANLKQLYSNLTQAKQPRPGPGSYSIPATIRPQSKPQKHQFFGSTTARFQNSTLDKAGATGNNIGPGKYETVDHIRLNEESKRKDFKKNQEIIAFHKLRQLFPEKTSISTT